jgi:hypothetical protein
MIEDRVRGSHGSHSFSAAARSKLGSYVARRRRKLLHGDTAGSHLGVALGGFPCVSALVITANAKYFGLGVFPGLASSAPLLWLHL